ncbi:SAM-dependent methyltransferase [Neorhizobium petrolearium]|uniref:SAM-dependent methyltransferase n=1 Tax=Neorhizobium petrolearium TaxID=515361 RepID=UPI003F5CD8EF
MSTLRNLTMACALMAISLDPAIAQTAPSQPTAGTYEPKVGQEGKDVVWVPTPQALVDRMLAMAEVSKEDYLIDLGSGDGRTVITAATLGVRAHGIEYNPDMVALSKRNAQAAGVEDRATFIQADIFESDFSEASVITLFLLPDLNLRLRPTLLDMKPGTRVVSNSFHMGDWRPDDQIDAGSECENYCRAYKWVVPAKVAGEWRLGDDQLTLTQTYQMLSGTLVRNGTAHEISEARMDGTNITFTAAGMRYRGSVDGNTMTGAAGNGDARWTAERQAD